jgi:hypothetical protein
MDICWLPLVRIIFRIRNRKQSKNTWKSLHVHQKSFYSATKKNEILSFASNWMELDNIILSEVTQVQKAKSCMFSLKCECKPNTNVAIL